MDTNLPGNDIQGEGQTGITPEVTPTGEQTPSDTSITGEAGGQASQSDPAKLKEENERLKGNLSAMQRNFLNLRRSIGSGNQPTGGQGQTGDFGQQVGGDLATQIAVAYEVADAQLRRQLEPIIELYPEMDAKDLARIRRNPWAFASREAFLTGDVNTALLDIEQIIAEHIAAKTQTPSVGTQPQTRLVNPNPAPTPPQAEEAIPGSAEDENPWTMPMQKLEGQVQKVKKQLTVK